LAAALKERVISLPWFTTIPQNVQYYSNDFVIDDQNIM
jgi:hypothetical protein